MEYCMLLGGGSVKYTGLDRPEMFIVEKEPVSSRLRLEALAAEALMTRRVTPERPEFVASSGLLYGSKVKARNLRAESASASQVSSS